MVVSVPIVVLLALPAVVAGVQPARAGVRPTTAEKHFWPVLATRAPGTDAAALEDLRPSRRPGDRPVLGPDRTLVGVVSEADILITAERADPQGPPHHGWRPRARHTRRAAPTAKAGGKTARELMTTQVITVGPMATVARAARLMREEGLAWLPVVDEGMHVVGVLGRSDLLAVFYRRDRDIRAEIVEDVLGGR